jgi:hypothetical protein
MVTKIMMLSVKQYGAWVAIYFLVIVICSKFILENCFISYFIFIYSDLCTEHLKEHTSKTITFETEKSTSQKKEAIKKSVFSVVTENDLTKRQLTTGRRLSGNPKSSEQSLRGDLSLSQNERTQKRNLSVNTHLKIATSKNYRTKGENGAFKFIQRARNRIQKSKESPTDSANNEELNQGRMDSSPQEPDGLDGLSVRQLESLKENLDTENVRRNDGR